MIWADARLIAYQSGELLLEAMWGVVYLCRNCLKVINSPCLQWKNKVIRSILIKPANDMSNERKNNCSMLVLSHQKKEVFYNTKKSKIGWVDIILHSRVLYQIEYKLALMKPTELQANLVFCKYRENNIWLNSWWLWERSSSLLDINHKDKYKLFAKLIFYSWIFLSIF